MKWLPQHHKTVLKTDKLSALEKKALFKKYFHMLIRCSHYFTHFDVKSTQRQILLYSTNIKWHQLSGKKRKATNVPLLCMC